MKSGPSIMKKNEKLEISDEMIGATDGKTCCTAFADPFIKKTKKLHSEPAKRKAGQRASKDKEEP